MANKRRPGSAVPGSRRRQLRQQAASASALSRAEYGGSHSPNSPLHGFGIDNTFSTSDRGPSPPRSPRTPVGGRGLFAEPKEGVCGVSGGWEGGHAPIDADGDEWAGEDGSEWVGGEDAALFKQFEQNLQ